MTNPERICFACMGELPAEKAVCPSCGHDNHIRGNGPGFLNSSVLGGQYLTGKVLGRGGFGITYLGLDLRLNRRVAIKEYYPEGVVQRDPDTQRVAPFGMGMADAFEIGVSRAIKEARTAAQMEDIPNTVRIYSVLEENGTVYIVMEYIDGITLTSFIQQMGGKLPWVRAWPMIEPVLITLSRVHAKGIVHRDVSPDNIMIRYSDAMPVLLDFGTARDFTSGNTEHSTSLRLGFSPMEMYTSTGAIDQRSDEYAAMATLYYMLTGKKPESPLNVAAGIGEVKKPSSLGSDIPAGEGSAEEVLMRGLECRMNDRYRTIEELRQAFHRALEQGATMAAPLSGNEASERKKTGNTSTNKSEQNHNSARETEKQNDRISKDQVKRETQQQGKGGKKRLIPILAAVVVIVAAGAAVFLNVGNIGNIANIANIGNTGTAIKHKTEKYSDKYYSNGKIRVEHERNNQGNVSKINNYNRYGSIISYSVSEKWDAQGNILQDTEYCANNTGKYREYHNAYTYDNRGNMLTSAYTYADGSMGSSSEMQYDGNDHLITRTWKDSDGKITGIQKEFQYDENDNIIAYVSYNTDGKIDYHYQARYENGVQTESTETDQSGNTTDKRTYDPIYGDTLTSEYSDDEGNKYELFINYSDTFYEEDWRSLAHGYRFVTRYTTEGKRIREDSYEAASGSTDWVYEYTAEYSTNVSGNEIENRKYADGSTYYIERDQNWNEVFSRRTNADGSFNYAHSRVYDQNGNEIRSNFLTENGQIESYVQYEYDKKGNEISRVYYEADGKFDFGYSFEYDSQGRAIRENRLRANGTVESYEVYEYNADGNKSRTNRYDSDGALKSYEIYDYYTNGEQSCSRAYAANGSKESETQYDENGDMTYWVMYFSTGSKTEYYYRTLENGTRQSKRISYKTDGTIEEEGEWENN